MHYFEPWMRVTTFDGTSFQPNPPMMFVDLRWSGFRWDLLCKFYLFVHPVCCWVCRRKQQVRAASHFWAWIRWRYTVVCLLFWTCLFGENLYSTATVSVHLLECRLAADALCGMTKFELKSQVQTSFQTNRWIVEHSRNRALVVYTMHHSKFQSMPICFVFGAGSEIWPMFGGALIKNSPTHIYMPQVQCGIVCDFGLDHLAYGMHFNDALRIQQ